MHFKVPLRKLEYKPQKGRKYFKYLYPQKNFNSEYIVNTYNNKKISNPIKNGPMTATFYKRKCTNDLLVHQKILNH